ncbi:ribbon-helix-helix protein, CopG family [Candidatus Woesearchaeota archaeon]|nr:ribbon-helix-helix protein, CopG family [Candidatus Woesearchaeota archaeon]
MGVVTLRLNESVSGFVELLSRDRDKSRSEIVRELLTKAVGEEKVRFWLEKYRKRQVTLRRVAKELNLPLWSVLEIVGENQSYEWSDLHEDLKRFGG